MVKKLKRIETAYLTVFLFPPQIDFSNSLIAVLRKNSAGRSFLWFHEVTGNSQSLCLAKTLAGFEMNNVAAAPLPAFCVREATKG